MIKEELIGQGRTADVYKWGDHCVLKLYADWCQADWADHEAWVSRMAFNSGLPVPEVIEELVLEGRKGIVFNQINGQTMLKIMGKEIWKLFELAGLMAELHAEMHEKKVPDLPSQRQRLIYNINRADVLDSSVKHAVLKALDALPDDTSVCHGDFHPDNILLSEKGAYIIDWSNAVSGHPLADVARTCIMLESKYLPPEMPFLLKVVVQCMRKIFNSLYLKRYMKLRHVTREQIDEWRLPVAAARLTEKVPGDEEQLLKYIVDTVNKSFK